MMVLDASALFAVFLEEEETPRLLEHMKRSPLYISAATRLECHVVALRSYPFISASQIDGFLAALETKVMAVENTQIDLAIAAYQRFGKGRHKASLNFGDCFSYALARETGAPLLCKGDDFVHTDIKIVAI